MVLLVDQKSVFLSNGRYLDNQCRKEVHSKEHRQSETHREDTMEIITFQASSVGPYYKSFLSQLGNLHLADMDAYILQSSIGIRFEK